MPPVRTEKPETSSPSKARKYHVNHRTLLDGLGIDKDTLEALLTNVRTLVATLFDVKMFMKDQPTEVTELELQLTNKWPALFEGKPENFKLIYHYAQKRFGQNRHEAKKANIKMEEQEQVESLLSMLHESSGSPRPTPPTLAEGVVDIDDPVPQFTDLAQEHEDVDEPTAVQSTIQANLPPPYWGMTQGGSPSLLRIPAFRQPSEPQAPSDVDAEMDVASPAPSQTAKTLPLLPSTPQHSLSLGGPSRLATIPSSSSTVVEPCPPPVTSQTPTTTPTTITDDDDCLVKYYSGSQSRQIEGLRYFLTKFCKPSMDHFLNAFLQHGCLSLAHLEPLQSYPDTRIDEILRELRSEGREMTRWEVIILRMAILHFPFRDREGGLLPYVESC